MSPSNSSTSSSSAIANGVPSNSFPRGADVTFALTRAPTVYPVLFSILTPFDSRFSLGSSLSVNSTTGVFAS